MSRRFTAQYYTYWCNVATARYGQRLADADLQIAATAIYHGLEPVTGNARHFARVPHLRVHPALLAARAPRP
jgi:predicted nucleic acid-binding protein